MLHKEGEPDSVDRQDAASAHTAHSLRSWRSRSSLGKSRTRSKSPPRSPDAHLHRIYSSSFADDHGTYVGDDDYEPPRGHASANEPGAASSRPPDAKDAEKCLEEVESQDDDLCSDADERPQGLVDGDRDPEKASSLELPQATTSAGSQGERDPNMVSWEGPDDPENPKNWSVFPASTPCRPERCANSPQGRVSESGQQSSLSLPLRSSRLSRQAWWRPL